MTDIIITAKEKAAVADGFSLEKIKYSREAVCKKRFVASPAVLSPVLKFHLIQSWGRADCLLSLDNWSCEQQRELRELAMSYTEKLLITADGEGSWLISPAVFPSATLCIALKYNIASSVLCKMLESSDISFVLSRYAERSGVHLNAIQREKRKAVLRSAKELEGCFCDIYRLDRCFNRAEQRRILADQCSRLSMLVGCPVTLELARAEEDDYSKTDFPLFSAFILTVLMAAKSNSPTRAANIKITSKGAAAYLEICFDCEKALSLSRYQLEWTAFCADKGIYCSFREHDGKAVAVLHPLRDDRLYLEIKQRFEHFHK